MPLDSRQGALCINYVSLSVRPSRLKSLYNLLLLQSINLELDTGILKMCMCLLKEKKSLFYKISAFFVEHACAKARHSCYYFGKVYVRACVRASMCACEYVRPSVWICPGHNSYIYG